MSILAASRHLWQHADSLDQTHVCSSSGERSTSCRLCRFAQWTCALIYLYAAAMKDKYLMQGHFICLLDACACRQAHDRMTEQVYLEPLRSFATSVTPGPVFTIPVLEKGRAALEQINEELGLAFDEQDLVYYNRMFQDEMKRDPTNVELFDIAQSNSEHRCVPYCYPLGLEERSMQKGPTLPCAALKQTTPSSLCLLQLVMRSAPALLCSF